MSNREKKEAGEALARLKTFLQQQDVELEQDLDTVSHFMANLRRARSSLNEELANLKEQRNHLVEAVQEIHSAVINYYLNESTDQQEMNQIDNLCSTVRKKVLQLRENQ